MILSDLIEDDQRQGSSADWNHQTSRRVASFRAGHFGAKVIRAHKTRRSERGGVRRKLEGKAGENDRKDL
jgi:hypothetical protein